MFVYQREGKHWTPTELSTAGAIALPSLRVELTLEQIYDGVA